MTLTDALDDLISAERIDPQLAIKILTQFDRIVAESLQEKVKSRLTFKVNATYFSSAQRDETRERRENTVYSPPPQPPSDSCVEKRLC